MLILERGGKRVNGSKQSLCIISWGRCMLIPMQNQFDLGRLSWDGVAIRQLDQKQSFLHHKLGNSDNLSRLRFFKALGILSLHFGPCLMKLRSSTRREAPSS